MLALFTNSWRRKAAIVALVFYALGIAAPAAAFALTDTRAHCLTVAEAHQTVHSHQAHQGDDREHVPQPASDHQKLPDKCCGAFCVTALAPANTPVTTPAPQVSTVTPLLIADLPGHGSDRIDRPPRSLSPL